MVRRTFLLLFATVLCMIGLDQLFVVFGLPAVRGTSFYNAALTFPASINDTFYTIWFCETIALLIFPLVLYLFRKKITAPLLPWLIVMLVMGVGLVTTISRGVHVYRQSNLSLDRSLRVSLVHEGAAYMTYPGELDTMLHSVFPYFLRAQIPVAAAIGAGYGIHYTLTYYRKRPKDNYPQKLP